MKRKKTLVVPAAGRSTRYSGVPKFLLRHPDGSLMIEKAIGSLGRENLHEVDEVIVVTRSEILIDSAIDASHFSDYLCQRLEIPVRVFELEVETRSMVETIVRCLEEQDEDRPFMIRDTDNFVSIDPARLAEIQENFVVYADLSVFRDVSPVNKGFVQVGSFNQVIGLVEKQIIGKEIYVGMAGFEAYSQFMYASKILGESPSEHYVTDIVRTLIADGATFLAVNASLYSDWGTEVDWSREKAAHQSLVCDLEGYLAEAPGPLGVTADRLQMRPELRRLAAWMQNHKQSQLVVFTSLFESSNFPSVKEWLSQAGIKSSQVQVISGNTGVQRTALWNQLPGE